MKLSKELKIIKFDESIKSTLFKNYLNFQGRASRSDSIWWFIFTLIISIAFNQFDSNAGSLSNLSSVFSIILFPPGLSLTVRRLHDINKSGWNYLWIITIVGIFPLIYWTLFKEGDLLENRYGKKLFDESD